MRLKVLTSSPSSLTVTAFHSWGISNLKEITIMFKSWRWHSDKPKLHKRSGKMSAPLARTFSTHAVVHQRRLGPDGKTEKSKKWRWDKTCKSNHNIQFLSFKNRPPDFRKSAVLNSKTHMFPQFLRSRQHHSTLLQDAEKKWLKLQRTKHSTLEPPPTPARSSLVWAFQSPCRWLASPPTSRLSKCSTVCFSTKITSWAFSGGFTETLTKLCRFTRSLHTCNKCHPARAEVFINGVVLPMFKPGLFTQEICVTGFLQCLPAFDHNCLSSTELR